MYKLQRRIRNYRTKKLQQAWEDGYCAEGRENIDIIDRNLSFSISRNINSHYCAQIDKDYSKCLYPRFGYALDIKKKIVYKSGKLPDLCAKYDSEVEKCVEFFPKMIPRPKNGLPILINQFINSQKIDYLKSAESLTTIICKDNYDFIGSLDNPIGCIFKILGGSQNKPIPNCKEHIYNNMLCKKCKNGYSIHKNKHSCLNIKIKNCIEYDEIQGKIICWTCKPFYRFSFGKCIKMDNCLKISQNNPNWCKQRSSDYLPGLKNQGYDDDHSNQQNAFYQLQDRIKNFDQNYCKEKSNFISYNNVEKLNTDFDLSHPQTIDFFKINFYVTPTCNKRINYPIKGCSKYHTFLDSCQECDQGYFIENQSGEFTRQSKKLPKKNHYGHYNYICKEKNPQYKKQNIQYCIVYSPDGQTCIQCEQGYYENGNSCIEGIENCLIHQSQYQCIKCMKGYINFTYFDYILYGFLHPQEACVKNENMIMKTIKEGFSIVKNENNYKIECSKFCEERKYCKSIFTTNKPGECLLTISGYYFINYPLYKEMEVYPLEICERDKCLKCKYDRCLKCEQDYVLDSNFQCQRACIKNKIQIDCIDIDNSEDENLNEIGEDKNQTNDTTGDNNDKNINEGKDQNNENKGNGRNNKDKGEENQEQIKDLKEQETSSDTPHMIIIFLTGILLGVTIVILYRWIRKRTLTRQQQGMNYQEQISDV